MDIKDYNLKSLRSHIGFVGQEPVLFATTIKENLLLSKPNATEEEMIKVLKETRAWEFIDKLEHKLGLFF